MNGIPSMSSLLLVAVSHRSSNFVFFSSSFVFFVTGSDPSCVVQLGLDLSSNDGRLDVGEGSGGWWADGAEETLGVRFRFWRAIGRGWGG